MLSKNLSFKKTGLVKSQRPMLIQTKISSYMQNIYDLYGNLFLQALNMQKNSLGKAINKFWLYTSFFIFQDNAWHSTVSRYLGSHDFQRSIKAHLLIFIRWCALVTNNLPICTTDKSTTDKRQKFQN